MRMRPWLKMYRYWSLWGLFLAEQVNVTDFMDVVCRSRAFDGMIFKKSFFERCISRWYNSVRSTCRIGCSLNLQKCRYTSLPKIARYQGIFPPPTKVLSSISTIQSFRTAVRHEDKPALLIHEDNSGQQGAPRGRGGKGRMRDTGSSRSCYLDYGSGTKVCLSLSSRGPRKRAGHEGQTTANWHGEAWRVAVRPIG